MRRELSMNLSKKRILKPASSTKRLTKNDSVRKRADMERENRIKKIYEVYKKSGSVTKTGKIFRISAERARQLLRRGEEEGIIKFLPAETLRFSALFNRIDRFDLIRDIENARKVEEIHAKYAVGVKELCRLLKCFGLNYAAIKRSAGITRCNREYLQILNTLNHHPSTFELQSNKAWKALYARICFTWGNPDGFRRACGFRKPPRTKRAEAGRIRAVKGI